MPQNTDMVFLKEGFLRNKAVTSSGITNAKTKMTATELKIFYQVATLIKMDDTNFKEYEISVSEFEKALNLASANRDFLKATLRRIIKQLVEIEHENGDWIAYTIFTKMHYKSKEQKILMKFNDEIRQHLLALRANFTTIQNIDYIKKFDSKYSIRFYAMLKDYRKMSQRDFNLNELAQIFELPKSYQNYSNFKKFVIDPAIREINEKSDLYVTEPEIIGRKGKKITDIRLYFGNKSEQMAGDLRKSIVKYYNTHRNVQVFNGFLWAMTGETQQNFYKIIRTEKVASGWRLFVADSRGAVAQAFSDIESKLEYLNEVMGGIQRAVILKYEYEKKQQLPLKMWQGEQDEKRAATERTREILAVMAEKANIKE